MSKGYTISYFINTFRNVTKRNLTTTEVYNTVSPRFGMLSVKADALDSWLNFHTREITWGEGRFAEYGKTARTRLLRALKNRKENGFV